MEKTEIKKLVSEAQSGNKQALEKLYSEYHSKVYFFVRRFAGDGAIAEDLTSETFTAALERIGELRSDESFAGWLYSIAYKKCVDFLRNESRTVSVRTPAELEELLEGAALNEPILLPEDYAVNAETRLQLKEIIDGLTPDQRSAVIMYYYDEMSIPEVATAMGTNENNVSQKLHRARKKIRAKIEKLIGRGALFGAVPMGTMLGEIGASPAGLAAVGAAVAVPYGLSKASGGTARELLWITRKYWSKHKKSLAALLFSGVLLCAVVCCAFLMIRQEQRRWFENYYDTHGKYTLAVPTNTGLDDVIGLVSTDETVRGEISVTGTEGIGKYRYHIGTIDDPHDLAHIPLEAGRMPETADEIAIDRGVLKKFGYFGNVGDDIALDGGTYKLVGIIDEKYGANHYGSLLMEQRLNEGQLYADEKYRSTRYMPLMFTGGNSKAEYKWIMLDRIIDLKPKTISSPAEELGEYLRAGGVQLDNVYKDAPIQLWDFYNYKPAIAKMYLVGYDNVELSSKTRTLLVLTVISVIIAVLSVIATLRNVFAERENSMAMLRRIGLSKRRLRIMYLTECLILIVIQTVIGIGIGSAAHLTITKIQSALIDKLDITGFTLDPLITDNSLDPFVLAVIGSAAVLGAGYLIVGFFNGMKARRVKKKKAGSLRACISRVFRSRAVTVIQTAALTLICFGTLFGYMLYHNTTGDYYTDASGEVRFVENVTTNFGPAYQFDLEEDNIKEYYRTTSSPDVAVGSLKLVKVQDSYSGIDDKTADNLGDAISSGRLSQTFISANDSRELGNKLIFGTAEEIKFFRDNSSDEGKALFDTDKTYYSCPTVLADIGTLNSLSQYVVYGEIHPEKLSSGEEILIVVKSGEVPLSVGDSLTIGSAATSNGFGVDKLSLTDTRIGAVVQLPKEMDRILKYAVSEGNSFNLLTTVNGAKGLGLHAASYTELFARDAIGSKLPVGSGLEVLSLEQQRHEIFVRNAEQYVSMGLLVVLMSLLGFAAYFNGIGMKIRLKEYQISVMRAIGSPVKKLRSKMTIDSIRIPVAAAAGAYAMMRLTQLVMQTAYNKAGALREQANKLFEEGDLSQFDVVLNKSQIMEQQFMTGTQMWYVNAFIPTLTVFVVMCIVTILLTRRSFKMFTPDIAGALARGRKRR